jgi:hypothetical protein
MGANQILTWVNFALIAANPKNEKAAVRPPQLKNIKGRFAQLHLRCLTTARDDAF